MATESTRIHKETVNRTRVIPWRAIGAYAAMLAVAAAIFFIVVRLGATLTAPPPPAVPIEIARQNAPVATNLVVHVLLALAAVIGLGRLLGALLSRVRQPPVIGEVLAGIMLGPSLLSRVAPGVGGFLLPDSITPSLALISQIGVVLYMFI